MPNADYLFTNTWFDRHKAIWNQLLNQLKPERILEVGCYEGNSTTHIIESLSHQSSLEIHCIDSWEGGIEHKAGGSLETDMSEVETRFHHNIKTAKSRARHEPTIVVHKGMSNRELPQLIADGKQGYFDLIYIDGSHQAADVLLDSVLAFELLRRDGVIAFDDYLWQEALPGGTDPLRCPKVAIDAFTNIYCRKLRILSAPLYQLYARKISS
jgi:predicted O-methyltransferase YrrM